MPYYSVHITGGKDSAAAGREARELFNGTDADYTGSANFFYVERRYDLDTLQANVEGSLRGKYNVDVKEISKEEFFWRKNR